jgi:hypothetical protein
MRRLIGIGLVLILSSASALQAQTSNASLTGRVTDSSKAVISDARVRLISRGTNLQFEGTTNASGIYYVTNLPPGTYSIAVEKVGFKAVIKPEVVLHVEDVIQVNFEMAVGSVSETVTVRSELSAVQLATSTIGDVVNSTTVRELPLNGRSWTDLANLEPGVTLIRAIVSNTNPQQRLGRGLGAQLSITGARPQGNNYVLNGININDYANASPGSIVGANLGVDAVEEFSLLTSNYAAEYGRTSGGVVSAITRSGTNQFHGTAYEFLRNSALDARNYFDGNKIPPFRRNQFGGSVGGPIQKDKTFIFGDYEGLRETLSTSMIDTVPSLAARAGTLSTGNIIVDPSVQKFLGLYPLPNGPSFGDTAEFSINGSQITRDDFFTVRVDHKLVKDTLSGSYSFDLAHNSQSDEFNNKVITSGTRRQVATFEHVHVLSPTLVNSLRLGVNRVHASSPESARAINPLAADPSLGTVPGDSAPTVQVPGLTNFSGGLSTQAPQFFNWTSWQAYDSVLFTKGIHSITFGANVERIEDNNFQVAHPGGTYAFNTLSDFLTNTPHSLKCDLPQFVTERGLRQTIVGAYLQDDVRFRPNLTLNVGLRYEPSTVPAEVEGKLSVLRNLTDTTPHLGNPIIANPTLRNFEPRVGFSWDPFRDGKTAVRGGFGIFDVPLMPIELRGAVYAVWPFFDTTNFKNLPVGSFPSGGFQLLTPSASTARYVYINPNPSRNYVMQWNLNIQRQLPKETTAFIGYVGSRSLHNVLQVDDMDIVLPTLTPQGYVWPSPAGSGQVINPNVGRIEGSLFESSAIYHGLELQVKKRMSHGLQIQGSYTWSRSIDTGSGTTDGDQFANGITSLFFFDPKLRRGPSDFNISQVLTINYIWELPRPSFSGAGAWPLSGWELGGIFQANTGQPFTVILGGDPLGLNNVDPFDFPDRLTGPGCGSLANPGNPNNYIKLQCFAFPNPVTRLGTAGRNIVIGPGLTSFDVSLFKNNPIRRISESFNAQFRVEMFNVLNHANFNPPTNNITIFDGSGVPVPGAGLIDSTSTTSRQIQFALKLIW